MAEILNGKEVSAYIREQIKSKCADLSEIGIAPGLAVILVGNDPASEIYVRNKKKACDEVGIYSEEYRLDSNTTQHQLLDLIYDLNQKPDIDGILVQLPLPSHIDEKAVIAAIDSSKDVDAFSNQSVGRLSVGNPIFLPCTPAGIMEILKYYKIDVESKECVIVGRSNIVGKPMAMMMLNANATVTICHSKTNNLKEICKRADILIVAVGKKKLIDAEYVKPGAVVIDVGMNRDENGKLCGDVDFESVKDVASYITPVPGGVGPMTISMLLYNTIRNL
ncbi:MAG: bifunctional methylenetetrahydrofolate dehydrogenase/methenyltetrahydrofolate cyclohydrolase FolD [Clostridia bacterium]|nr:bifunctional methylenetetrahydrofolate dehydrogenase/methenyltetrahydrofolate cyclohydrolase FolD [Clostridia bacterium]